jgi:hypothetical protein
MDFDLSKSGAYYLVFSNVSSDLSRTVTADVSFTYLPQTEIPLQQDPADQPGQSLLAFFPEFFPDGVKHSLPLSEIFPGGPLKDGIPALTNPTTVAASAADYLNDTDLVLGITINGESRAYPLRILNWHEIANDTLGGKPLAVTFCPLCGTGIAFDPVVDGEAIEFGVSGLLHNSDLLMYDRGTDTPSLWAQALGEAVVGPRTSTLLDLLPITQAQWGEWKAIHPNTTVLSIETGHDKNYNANPYPGYEESPDVQTSLNQKTKVLGVRLGNASKAYVLADLRRTQLLNDDVAGVPVVLIASPDSDSVRVYERKTHQFEGSVEKVVEIGTNEVWEISEESLFNPKTGDALARLPEVFVSFWFAWFSFYPDTVFYEAPLMVNPATQRLTTWAEIKR